MRASYERVGDVLPASPDALGSHRTRIHRRFLHRCPGLIARVRTRCPRRFLLGFSCFPCISRCCVRFKRFCADGPADVGGGGPRAYLLATPVRALVHPGRLGCSVYRCCPARHCVPATSPGPVRSLEPVVADVHGESPDGRSRNGDGSHTRLGCDPQPVGILPALGTRLTEPFSPFKRVRSHKPTPRASALPAPSNADPHPAQGPASLYQLLTHPGVPAHNTSLHPCH